jgi:hypothetical protein
MIPWRLSVRPPTPPPAANRSWPASGREVSPEFSAASSVEGAGTAGRRLRTLEKSAWNDPRRRFRLGKFPPRTVGYGIVTYGFLLHLRTAVA